MLGLPLGDWVAMSADTVMKVPTAVRDESHETDPAGNVILADLTVIRRDKAVTTAYNRRCQICSSPAPFACYSLPQQDDTQALPGLGLVKEKAQVSAPSPVSLSEGLLDSDRLSERIAGDLELRHTIETISKRSLPSEDPALPLVEKPAYFLSEPVQPLLLSTLQKSLHASLHRASCSRAFDHSAKAREV